MIKVFPFGSGTYDDVLNKKRKLADVTQLANVTQLFINKSKNLE